MSKRRTPSPAAPRPRGPFRNRIVASGERPAREFLANPANWRIHGRLQQQALTSVLAEVGWVQQVVVNKRTGHMLDGHLRVELALSEGEDTMVPFVEVDITPKEERLLLAVFDPIGDLAGTDDDKLGELIADLPETGVDLDAVLRLDREVTQGLTRDVRINACTCCQHKCAPGCGCYPKEPKKSKTKKGRA